MTVLVLGATGTVGRDVVGQLASRGVAVRAASRAAGPVGAGVDAGPVRFDLDDRSSWRPAVEGCNALFLLRPPQEARVRRDLIPFVDVALAAGVERVAFLSVQGAARNPLLPHHTVEQHIRRSGCAWTFLRPAYFFQNLIKALGPGIRDSDEIAVPAGSGRTAFVDTRDVAEVAAMALTDASGRYAEQAYELTGPAALPYAEIAEELTRVLGRRIRYRPLGPVEHWRRTRAAGEPAGFAAVTLILYSLARLGLAAHLSNDLPDLLRRPARDLHDFVVDHAGVWRR